MSVSVKPIMGHLPFFLSHHIDIQIAAQMPVGILTFKVGFTGIHMSLVIVVKVVLGLIFGHDITSSVIWLVSGYLLRVIYSIQPDMQYEPVGRMVGGQNYLCVGDGWPLAMGFVLPAALMDLRMSVETDRCQG